MVSMALLLSACGGGGGGSDAGSDDPPSASNPPPAPPPVNAVASLNWDRPTERENGDALPLAEVGGYEISYRRVGDELFTAIVIEDGSVNEFVLEDMEAGSYEIYISSFDIDGNYSSASEIIIAAI